jgi:hypothetical protein
MVRIVSYHIKNIDDGRDHHSDVNMCITLGSAIRCLIEVIVPPKKGDQ